MFKITDSVYGVPKQCLGKLSGCQKEVFEKKWHFSFLSFYVGERQRENKKNKKGTSQQKTRQIVSWGVGGGKEATLLKLTCFRKIAKHYLVSEGGQKGIFVDFICFGKCHFFWFELQIMKYYKDRGFSGHMGKTENAHFV